MLDLTQHLAQFRTWLSDVEPSRGRHRVVHLVAPGPTLPHNKSVDGYGPWARVYAFAEPIVLNYPGNYKLRAKLPTFGDYLVVLLFPRIVTTNNFLEVVLHEYLHIGEARGALVHHPPRQEDEFINMAREWASMVRAKPGFSAFARVFDSAWDCMRDDGVYGLANALFTGEPLAACPGWLQLEFMDLKELN